MKRLKHYKVSLMLIAMMTTALTTLAYGKTIYVDDDAAGANDGSSWENAYVYLQDALADANESEKPVKWLISEGGNGHIYQVVATPEGISWSDAKEVAEAAGGYLATITSEEENEFVFELIDDDVYWHHFASGNNHGPWIGGFQREGAMEPDGGWSWITGEIFSYSNWLSGEPTGYWGANNENRMQYSSMTGTREPTWNDLIDVLPDFYAVYAYVIEYEEYISEPVEIRVAQGVYKPDEGIVTIPEFDRRMLTFQLINGVDIKGGYAGLSEPDPNARVVALYKTILSGDLNGDDVEVADPCDLIDESTRAENSYHVATGSGTNGTAIIDGFTITSGNANDPNENSYGAGMCNEFGCPTVTNCTFRSNSAADSGGGMGNIFSSPTTVINCIFQGNSAGEDGGGIDISFDSPSVVIDCIFSCNSAGDNGGGMCNDISCDTVVESCIFIGNSTGKEGGGMYNCVSRPTVTNCEFRGNKAVGNGGGMCNDFLCDMIAKNCIFAGNSSYEKGGGMASFGSRPVMNNCTFTGNRAAYGNALACDLGYDLDGNERPSHVRSINCIIWDGNSDGTWRENTSTITVSHSCFQGGWEGEGNIDANPLFVDPNSGDYHLKSQAGHWDPNDGWVKDDVTSPCIDAGDPNSDYSAETWPHGGRINMGAYGGTREASMSTQTDGMSLPRVLYIYGYDIIATLSFNSLLEMYGVAVTFISFNNFEQVSLTDYNLIIVADDITWSQALEDDQFIGAVEDSGKPVIGLGDGGYDFFGELGLSIGNPYGGHGRKNGIRVVDPEYSLFSTPYQIDILDDQILQLYTETDHVAIYLWPEVPETITVIGSEPDHAGYYPLVMQHNRYLLWGFDETPQNMTETGKRLFINVVIWTANAGWES
jgi:hypothetical protein